MPARPCGQPRGPIEGAPHGCFPRHHGVRQAAQAAAARRIARADQGERNANPLLWTVVACAVAIATFSGITAWETHQDRVNTEVIYCTLFSGIETDDDGDPVTLTDQRQRLSDQLGC